MVFVLILTAPAYSATTIENPRQFHDLTELAQRQGWRRLTDTERDGTLANGRRAYLSERTVFHDTVTGCIIWRMTCDPAVDKNDYYDIPGWNANGSLMTFLTRRAAGTQRWLMNADGSSLRPMLALDGQSIRIGYWSVIYSDRFYDTVKIKICLTTVKIILESKQYNNKIAKTVSHDPFPVFDRRQKGQGRLELFPKLYIER